MKNDNMKKKIATGILVGTSITGIASSAVLAANTTNIADDEVNANIKQSVQVSSERSSAKRGRKTEKKLPEDIAKAPNYYMNTQHTYNSYVFKHRGSGEYQKLIKGKFQEYMLGGYTHAYYGYVSDVDVAKKKFSVYTGLFSVGDRLYLADDNGDIQTGLRKIGENLYYFGEDKTKAYARTGWYVNGDTQYYFGADGKAVKGFKNFNDVLMYFNNEGKRVLDIVEMNGNIYYYENGKPFTGGLKKIGKDVFYFGADGKAVKNGEVEDGQFKYELDNYIVKAMSGILK